MVWSLVVLAQLESTKTSTQAIPVQAAPMVPQLGEEEHGLLKSANVRGWFVKIDIHLFYGVSIVRISLIIIMISTAECEAGHVSETGLQPCYPCPPNHFQHDTASSHCYRCPDGSTSNATAASSMDSCDGVQEDLLVI